MSAKRGLRAPVLCVVGARPNYMKMAPLVRAFAGHPDIPQAVLVHTGQHYDTDMNERLFSDLGLPAPDFNLEVGSGSHAQQTAEIMRRFEPLLQDVSPSCVVVVGDVNSTLACSLVASKSLVPLVHVEAGLRSFDRTMPEEINRVLTDQIADVLYTTEQSAAANLAREGISSSRIRFVGNVMIDSVLANRGRAKAPRETLALEGVDATPFEGDARFAVATLHRPANVDEAGELNRVVTTLVEVSKRLRVIWPVHPRTRANLERFGIQSLVRASRIVMLPPQGYLEMLGLLDHAQVVLTDSGGIQEETTALGVPCLTMRDTTERPITVEQGTNTIVGRNHDFTLACVREILEGRGKRGRRPPLWDGLAAERIASDLAEWLAARKRLPEAVDP